MNNKKCPNCGFINFLKDESCRKCFEALDGVATPEVVNSGSGYTYVHGNQTHYQALPQKGMSPIWKVVLGIIALFIFIPTIAGVVIVAKFGHRSKVVWREFRPETTEVTVMMPTEPSRSEPVITPSAVGTITNHVYTATVGGQGSALYCVVDFSSDLSKYEGSFDKMMEAELNGMVKRTDSTLVNKGQTNIGSFPALIFEMRPSGNLNLTSARSFGKMFIARNQLHVLVITASEKSELFEGKDKFLNPSIPPL